MEGLDASAEQAQGLRLMKFEEVYGRTRSRLLSQAEAAEVLGVSERTFRRWRERYEAEGADGLYDRRLGRLSPARAGGRGGAGAGVVRPFTAKHFHEKPEHDCELGAPDLAGTWAHAGCAPARRAPAQIPA